MHFSAITNKMDAACNEQMYSYNSLESNGQKKKKTGRTGTSEVASAIMWFIKAYQSKAQNTYKVFIATIGCHVSLKRDAMHRQLSWLYRVLV